nr:MAG TPA: hypothetical protein [Caudoviricetes sp.]
MHTLTNILYRNQLVPYHRLYRIYSLTNTVIVIYCC